jgi:hypothetical protein
VRDVSHPMSNCSAISWPANVIFKEDDNEEEYDDYDDDEVPFLLDRHA